MTYTISVQARDGEFQRVALKRRKTTKDEAMKAAWEFSKTVTLCDVVVTCGSKHVVTYKEGFLTVWNGKEQKP